MIGLLLRLHIISIGQQQSDSIGQAGRQGAKQINFLNACGTDGRLGPAITFGFQQGRRARKAEDLAGAFPCLTGSQAQASRYKAVFI
jgi:hypothetical protein